MLVGPILSAFQMCSVFFLFPAQPLIASHGPYKYPNKISFEALTSHDGLTIHLPCFVSSTDEESHNGCRGT
ncbi:hypothetical protein BD769DRAFT_1486087 [Suillus cothurnatus]|nr:hypothetical protein BD769DRAFT_1486087 [Suillus cothurnatus]